MLEFLTFLSIYKSEFLISDSLKKYVHRRVDVALKLAKPATKETPKLP